MTLQLGMVVLDVSDLDRSISFYRLLGLDVPDRRPDRPVTLHTMASGVSIVLIEGFAATLDPGWTRPTGYQQALEFYVGDEGAIRPTGLYAAVVDDPDGNAILISSDPNADPGR